MDKDINLTWDRAQQQFAERQQKKGLRKSLLQNLEYYFEFLSDIKPPAFKKRPGNPTNKPFTLF